MLKDYPAARVRLESIAVKRLEKYKKAPLEKGMLLFLRSYILRHVNDMLLIDVSVNVCGPTPLITVTLQFFEFPIGYS